MVTTKYIKDSKELGENLKTARTKSGITQYTVSKLTNLNRSSLSYYENGINIPTIFTIIKLMGIYKISINEVILARKTN
ncbi:MAG: helix-turn-helix transcriptional regulator [Clostridia bacterium]|nr:helix-turn-helix transcriptional regulator [Clostridia bacterium]